MIGSVDCFPAALGGIIPEDAAETVTRQTANMVLNMALHCSRTEVVDECWTLSTLTFTIKGYLYVKNDLQCHENRFKVQLRKMYSEERMKFLLPFGELLANSGHFTG